MNNCLLTFISDFRLLPDLNSRLFTFEVRIPKTELSVDPASILSIWTIHISDNKAFLVSRIRPDAIEMDGDSYIFYGNPAKSEYFSRDPYGVESFDLQQFDMNLATVFTDALSFHLISAEFEASLDAIAQSRWIKSFGSIPSSVSLAISSEIPAFMTSNTHLEKHIEISLRQKYATDELHIDSQAAAHVNPFVRTSQILAADFVLKDLTIFVDHRVKNRVVDLTLLPLSDDQTTPRKWLKIPDADDLLRTMQLGLVKTERAEAKHTQILLDCAKFIRKSGFDPKSSGSIDLAFDAFGSTFLIEIKSANPENFAAQLDKGLMQIQWYAWAMKNSIKRLIRCVIIELPKGLLIDFDDLSAFGEQMGVNVLFWDSVSEWPDRVRGLLSPPVSFIE